MSLDIIAIVFQYLKNSFQDPSKRSFKYSLLDISNRYCTEVVEFFDLSSDILG